jgi:polygalacturonase
VKHKIHLLLTCIAISFGTQAQTFNVKAYGAKGNGIADDRASIVSAINAAHAWSVARSIHKLLFGFLQL